MNDTATTDQATRYPSGSYVLTTERHPHGPGRVASVGRTQPVPGEVRATETHTGCLVIGTPEQLEPLAFTARPASEVRVGDVLRLASSAGRVAAIERQGEAGLLFRLSSRRSVPAAPDEHVAVARPAAQVVGGGSAEIGQDVIPGEAARRVLDVLRRRVRLTEREHDEASRWTADCLAAGMPVEDVRRAQEDEATAGGRRMEAREVEARVRALLHGA